MGFRLIAVDRSAGEKDVGDNVLLADLPADYKVYAFYYGAGMSDPVLIERLRALGEEAGKNLFVNIGRLNDPQHDKIVRLFGIEKYPVLAITALADLAASGDDHISAYARLDSEHLLSSPDRTIACLQELFSLFLQGKIAEAVSHAKWSQRAEFARTLGAVVGGALKKIGGFVLDRDIVISFAEVKLELKKSGG